jgi:hypothetical protein
MTQTTVNIPSTQSEWASVLEFKTPQEKDTVGLVDMKLGRNARIALVGKDDPISARKVNIPLECFTVDEFLGKGKGQMTLTIELTPKLWTCFNALDKCFDAFLVTHAAKLFSKQDAEYIRKDPSSIALKRPKPLARYNADGSPKIGGYLSLRVTGRGGEVEAIEVKDGPKGQYVASITFSEVTSPLLPSATRFAKLRTPTVVCTTLPREKVVLGQPKTRIVGPGDFHGGLIYSCSFVVSHWALVNGSASICIKATDVIFMNTAREIELPEGFTLDNEEEIEEGEEVDPPTKKAKVDEFTQTSKLKKLVDRPGGRLTEKETDLNEFD